MEYKYDILIATDTVKSNPWYRDRIPAIESALESHNSKIIDIYSFASEREAHEIHKRHKTDNYFHREKPDLLNINKQFLDKIIQNLPRVLVLGTVDCYGAFLLPETVREIQELGTKVVGILGDDEFNYGKNMWWIPLFDYTIAYVKTITNYFNQIKDNCFYLPNSCFFPEKDFEKLQIVDSNKKYDVLFMGAPFGVRPDLIRDLINAKVNVAIFGSPKWKEYKEFVPYYHGFADSNDIPDIIKKSKIYLSFLEDHLSGDLHMNTKVWDAVKYGQFTIVTHYEPLTKDYGLIEDESIVYYHSSQDLVKKVLYYLQYPEERKALAKRMFEKISADFDYEKMYRALFQKLVDLPTNPTQITAKITIINLTKEKYSSDNFDVVNLGRTNIRNLRSWLENEGPKLTTKFVIIRTGEVEYSSYLNDFSKVFKLKMDSPVKAVKLSTLMNGKRAYIRQNLSVLSGIVWDKDFLINHISDFRIFRNFIQINHKLDCSDFPLCSVADRTTIDKILDRLDQKISY